MIAAVPRAGRPLRFLGLTLGGWVLVRAGLLWPTLEAPRDLIRLVAPPARAAAMPPALGTRIAVVRPDAAATPRAAVVPPSAAVAVRRQVDASRLAIAAASFLRFGPAVPIGEAGAIPPPLRPTPVDPARRLTASAWAILRDGTGSGLPGGQLGGSQAGVRVAYALDAARRVAVTARVSAPFAGRGREVALGVEYRAPRLPLRVIAERRFALDPGQGATAVYAVGGTAPIPVAAGFRLEAYAQGGVVLRDRAEGFADGAARMTRAASRTLDLGVGAWGGAQAGAARVDVGPTIGVALPVAGRALRLSLDWRQRVAGHARPGSGPALSIGSDF